MDSERTTRLPGATELREWLGDIDIYWLDQLLKGRVTPGMAILDAGCGEGRNLRYLLRSGHEVFGVDQSPQAIEAVRSLSSSLAPKLPADNFRVEHVESMSFPDSAFDVVLSNAVLHFVDDEKQFHFMLEEMWRVLKRGGMFFARLASIIGLEGHAHHLHGRRFRLPDGTERFLVDEEMLLEATRALGATLLEPIKTVNVQNSRCMTTWCVRKGHPGAASG